MSGRLVGRVAVVTGVGRGLGRAVAEGFAREGATTIAVACTNSELDDVAARLGPVPGSLQSERVDIADGARRIRLVRVDRAAYRIGADAEANRIEALPRVQLGESRIIAAVPPSSSATSAVWIT